LGLAQKYETQQQDNTTGEEVEVKAMGGEPWVTASRPPPPLQGRRGERLCCGNTSNSEFRKISNR